MLQYKPGNKRHQQISDNAHIEERAIYMSVNYDPINREGNLLFQYVPYIIVNGEVKAKSDQNGKMYFNLKDIIMSRPEEGTINPMTGTDLSAFIGADVWAWFEWFFDHERNKEEPTEDNPVVTEEPTPPERGDIEGG